MADPSVETAPRQEISYQPEDEKRRIPDPVWSIGLSGGGYRAMLFHTGALWRLHRDRRARQDRNLLQRLGRLDRERLARADLGRADGARRRIPRRLRARHPRHGQHHGRRMVRARRHLDRQDPAARRGRLRPRAVQGHQAAQLPAAPLFIYDSSNLQTGALWRFTREYMGDYKIGYIEKPDLPLSVAVGASSAFPPILSPAVLKSPGTFRPAEPPPALRDPRYRSRVALSDGGVYDNLGLEPIIKRARTVLVSDGGSPFKTQPRPCGFWPLQIIRVLMSEDNQVRALRKRGLIDRYQLYTGLRTNNIDPWSIPDAAAIAREGTYWGITTHADDYPAKGGLPCPADPDRAARAHLDPPRAHEGGGQEHLINWGYAVCDYAIRSHVDGAIAPATQWPYPRGLN